MSSAFSTEPKFSHGSAPAIGVLLINLGTPSAATRKALRRYLKEFLLDPRVVEIPRFVWKPLLYSVILPFRSGKSARKYAAIWTEEGSPLRVHTARQAKLLQGYLGERIGAPVAVEHAMRYGDESIADGLARLRARNCDRILILPAYPQYAASSTGSAFDAVCMAVARLRNLPELRLVKHYHDHPAYIGALAAKIRSYWQQHGEPRHLVMSFHGVPRYTLDKGDPYHCECQKTARLLIEALGFEATRAHTTFQSRFGRTEWLKPYTIDVARELAKTDGRVDVVCPGFTSDCLETLEEIAIEVKTAYLKAGGKEFHYIPCLNQDPEWIKALSAIAIDHLGGWAAQDPAAEKAARLKSRERALALGAKD